MDSIQSMGVANSTKYRNWLYRNISKNRLTNAQFEIVISAIIAQNRNKLSYLRSPQRKANKCIKSEFAKWNDIYITKKISILLRSSIIVILIILTTIFFWRFKTKHKINFIFALPLINTQNNTHILSEFFSEKRIPINKKNLNVVQNKRINLPKKNSNNLKLVMSLDIYMISLLNFQQRIILIRQVIPNYINLFIMALENNSSIFAYRQLLLEIPISEMIIRLRLIDCIMTTNSAYILHHSLFYLIDEIKEINSIMIWYSENSFPKVSNFNSGKFDYEFFRYIRVKQHLVWTSEFKKFLSQFTNSKISCIGSILFYPKNTQSSQPALKNKIIDVLIFDVTPQSSFYEESFYTSKRMMSFIDSILHVTEKKEFKPIRIALKPKRKYLRIHDRKYVRFIQYLSQNKIVDTLDYESNLYDLIQRSRIVIGIPFTSAVLVAKELKVPCCYFIGDSKKFYVKTHFGIPVYNSRVNLEKFLKKHLELQPDATK